MKIYPKCIPCLLKRAYYEVQISDADSEDKYEAISIALKKLSEEFSEKKATFEVSTEMHRSVYDAIEKEDPYSEKKDLGNKMAENLLPRIQEELNKESNGFKEILIASIIANALDFGVLEHDVDLNELSKKFPEKIRESKLDIDNSKEIKKEIEDSNEIAFVVDNCGEIIVDKLLLKEINRISDANIVLYVRGEPIFNDVTLKEAEEVNVIELVDEVLELGERAVGVHPEYMLEDVKNRLFDSDLIISKGMANYESFSEMDNDLNIAYIFKAKCEPVADSIGSEVGDNVASLKRL